MLSRRYHGDLVLTNSDARSRLTTPRPPLLHTMVLSDVIFSYDFCPHLPNLPAGRASIGALLSGLRETD